MNPVSLVLSLALGTGCVSAGKYDAALADARQAKISAARQLADKNLELNAIERTSTQAQTRCVESIQALEASKRSFAQSLDEATAQNQQLRAELERQGKNVDQLLSAKGALASSLDQARMRLEELRRAQAAAEARAALFHDVALRLRRMIDAGELQVALRSGRMVLVMPTDVLFDSGKAKIGARGKEALAELGAVLGSMEGRRFQVAGHTDNDPIRFSGFTSNWQLSTERALAVVAFLVENGMRAETLSAAGYAEFDAVSPNDTPEDKARNRRIEITLQPNIDELVPVPLTP